MSELLKAGSILRRFFMKIINPNYIKNKIKKRKGFCRKCGQCCNKCKYLRNNKCAVYDNRPFFCYKDFPIDKSDQKAWEVKNCGYNFK